MVALYSGRTSVSGLRTFSSCYRLPADERPLLWVNRSATRPTQSVAYANWSMVHVLDRRCRCTIGRSLRNRSIVAQPTDPLPALCDQSIARIRRLCVTYSHTGQCHARYVALPNNSQYKICAICGNY